MGIQLKLFFIMWKVIKKEFIQIDFIYNNYLNIKMC